jgi:hypothetical protein
MMSHTATGEWQSFESRMRRRRAERLALRAEAAASAGFEEDARACLAEARTLVPDLPEIAVAEAALAHQPDSLVAVAEPLPSSRSPFVTFAAACILLAAFVGGWIAYRDVPVADESPAPVAQAAALVTEPAATSAPLTRPAPATPSLTTPAAAAPAPEPVADTSADLLAAPKSKPSVNAEAPIARDSRPTEPTPSATPLQVATNDALPTLPDVAPAPPPPAPPPAPATRVEPPPVTTAAVPTTGLADTVLRTTSVDVNAPVVEVSQEPRVRDVLNRYASAYSALDANAAERVWPTVNRGALARAFDGLASQRVNLGDCRVDVTGNKAHARCAGSTTWSPKVGSGTHNESRVWTFDLVRVGADWQILNARAQNR